MPSPTKQSPVYHKLIEAGAALVEVSGWLLAERFGDAGQEALAARSNVGLFDHSSVPKWEIKGADVAEFLSSVLGTNIPEPGGAALTSSGYVGRVSRHHALFILDQQEGTLAARINEKSSHTGCVHVMDRTCGFGCFLLCGPSARSVLRKLTAVDLRETSFPDLSCACGPMAAIRVLIVRKDRAALPGYEIFFSREYGEYLWDAMMEAGSEFQMRPFGLAAARLLEGSV